MSDQWEATTLGTLFSEPKERIIPADVSERYVGLEHLATDQPSIRVWGDSSDWTSLSNRFRSGDTLFGRLRPYLRKVALAPFAGVCSGEILVWRPRSDRVTPEFLHLISSSSRVLSHAVDVSAGSRMPRVSSKDLAAIPVEVPPLPVQLRLVAVMDSIDTQIEALQVEVEATERLLSGLRRDRFERLRHQKVRAGEKFDMLLGRQKSKRQEFGDHVAPYLRAANIGAGDLSLTDVKTMNFEPDERAKYALAPDDVVLVEGGSIGQASLWSGEIDGFVGFDKHVIRIRAREGVSLPHYALHWCHWSRETGAFAEQATGITIKALGFKRATDMQVSDLSLAEQANLVAPLVSMDREYVRLNEELERLRAFRSATLNALLSREVEIPESFDETIGFEGVA